MARLTDGTAAATARAGDGARRVTDTDVRLRPELTRIAVRYAQRYGGEWDYMLSARELALRDGTLPPGIARAVLNCLRTDPLAILEDPELGWLLSDPAVVRGALADALPAEHDTDPPPDVFGRDDWYDADQEEAPDRRVSISTIRLKVKFGMARRGEVIHIVREARLHWYPNWDGWGWEREPDVRVTWECSGRAGDPILIRDPDLATNRPCRQCFVQAGVEAMTSGG